VVKQRDRIPASWAGIPWWPAWTISPVTLVPGLSATFGPINCGERDRTADRDSSPSRTHFSDDGSRRQRVSECACLSADTGRVDGSVYERLLLGCATSR